MKIREFFGSKYFSSEARKGNTFLALGMMKLTMSTRHRKNILVLLGAIFTCIFVFTVLKPCFSDGRGLKAPPGGKQLLQANFYASDPNGSSGAIGNDWETVLKYKNEVYKYDRHMPLIFIGGMPRSGTTLMRAMLDAHPLVRCGEETRVVPRILQMVAQWRKSPKETLRLNEAGLTEDVLDAGVAAFILEVVARHGEPAARLCNKDPFTLKSADYLAKMFPKLKFIFMIRDGRATVHSMMTRHVTITGFDLQDFKQCLKKWNQAMTTMHEQCRLLGAEKCLPVFYEQLVLHPKPQLRRILEFLDLPWNENVLHHEKMIGKPGGISLSKVERSSDQVIKPVNLEALTSWIGHVPEDVSDNLEKLAPMMKVLGYDPNDPNPTYGNPDQIVREKTKDVIENQETWQKKAEQLLRINHEDVLNDVAVAA